LFPRFGGVFLTNCTRGGLDRWIRSARCGLNRLQLEPVRDLVHRISDQGLRSIMRTIRSRPSVNNPMARTSPSRTDTLWFDQDRQRIIRRPTALLTIPHPNAAAAPPHAADHRRVRDFRRLCTLPPPVACRFMVW
jgi:hypothetical protein